MTVAESLFDVVTYASHHILVTPTSASHHILVTPSLHYPFGPGAGYLQFSTPFKLNVNIL